MAKALICGSFDPITLGHMDIIRRAARIFDQVTVGVFANSEKKYLFSEEDRVRMISEQCETEGLTNVKAELCRGMVAHYVRDNGIDVIVKGVRGFADLEYEQMIDNANKLVYPKAETMLMLSEPRYAQISSTVVRELLKYGEDVSDIVPASVINRLNNKG